MGEGFGFLVLCFTSISNTLLFRLINASKSSAGMGLSIVFEKASRIQPRFPQKTKRSYADIVMWNTVHSPTIFVVVQPYCRRGRFVQFAHFHIICSSSRPLMVSPHVYHDRIFWSWLLVEMVQVCCGFITPIDATHHQM